MTTTPSVETDDCPFDENDPLWRDPVNDQWMFSAFERVAREFARQLFQQEAMPMTTGSQTRLNNVRALDQLYKLLERMARHHVSDAKRRDALSARNADDAFIALERRLLPLLERAVAERDSKGTDRR